MDPESVVICFLRYRGKVLLVRRAPTAETYPGRWGAITGSVDHEEPLATARMEIRGETQRADFELVRAGDPIDIDDETTGRRWRVHPFLFDVGGTDVRLNEEHDRGDWVWPPAIRRRRTVPGLWTAYRRVGPTPESIAHDTDHGSSTLSVHALEALRDGAAEAVDEPDGRARMREVAEALLGARPSMAAVTNRLNRAMASAASPAAVERTAVAGIERALAADAEAATIAGEHIEGDRVLTLSRSGTVEAALVDRAGSVVVAESRPAREGVDVAETLAETGLAVTLCTDAAVATVLATDAIDAVLVGADTVLPDGRIVNKTGTRAAAAAAAHEEIPVFVVAAVDKVSLGADPHLEAGDPRAVYDGGSAITAINPRFDVTPPELLSGLLTERGRLAEADLARLAEEHRGLAAWPEAW